MNKRHRPPCAVLFSWLAVWKPALDEESRVISVLDCERFGADDAPVESCIEESFDLASFDSCDDE